jgi:choline monooxygenase
MYNIVPGRLQMNSVIPIDADTCEVVFDYFYDTDEPEAVAMRLKDDLTFSEQVQQEDIDICERVQRGLHSRAYDRGRFSVEMEAGVHHFQQLLKASYRDAVSQKLG